MNTLLTGVPFMAVTRRDVLTALAAIGVGTDPFQRSLAAAVEQEAKQAKGVTITAEMVQQAEWIAGITLSETERKSVATALTGTFRGISDGRAIPLPNAVPPAFQFNATPGEWINGKPGNVSLPGKPDVKEAKATTDDDLAFLPAHKLAYLLEERKVSSVELTKFFLDRLRKYDPALKCVVSLTEDLAMKQAKKADEERVKGTIRGPLHGIPWGAKDLIAVPGYKTTWGAGHYKDQTIDEAATVYKKLEEQGMVLVAKLTLGALAMGDQWFGGMTRNPWDVKRGSSGSSAGSCSAVAAGCVPVAVGSETLGSIISPSRECGVTGLRPTFGRISRAGCMTLSWTMDKLGPLCRNVDDCALMLGAMHGADPADPTAQTRPFHWPSPKAVKGLKVGVFDGLNMPGYADAEKVLKELGVTTVPIKLPTKIPYSALRIILTSETASAFDDITKAGVKEGLGNWPTTFREGRFIPAVDYIRANRLRTLLMQEMAKVMEQVDLYLGGNDLLITNMTGHPTICMPAGFRKVGEKEMPYSITMTGRLFGESDLLAVAKGYQDATARHLKRPDMTKVTKENAGL
jgi:Asp-tRNA(Asn)/Glu-tRNA(Gln) amidotransferase A subunit family amidase